MFRPSVRKYAIDVGLPECDTTRIILAKGKLVILPSQTKRLHKAHKEIRQVAVNVSVVVETKAAIVAEEKKKQIAIAPVHLLGITATTYVDAERLRELAKHMRDVAMATGADYDKTR